MVVNQISIDDVLSRIAEYDTLNRDFEISFVRSGGEKKGSIKTIRVKFGAPATHQRKAKSDNIQRKGFKDNYTLNLTDVKQNKHCSPFISHIIKFNDLTVYH